MEHDDDEEWGSPVAHMIAGAVAGTAEHCGMFPVDTIKVCWNCNGIQPVAQY
jgi:hypothetical protein